MQLSQQKCTQFCSIILSSSDWALSLLICRAFFIKLFDDGTHVSEGFKDFLWLGISLGIEVLGISIDFNNLLVCFCVNLVLSFEIPEKIDEFVRVVHIHQHHLLRPI